VKTSKELRKVQGILGETSFSVVLPKHIASEAGISKGDYLEFFREGNRIVLQKAGMQMN
jgi:bifunctional DNA-binding transcriptional regulator/antitoxin component of YhaV-PrlF toxin-antitoxin module